MIVERVTYHSGALKIAGRVCRPAAAGRYPIVEYNHGGWFGLDQDSLLADCPTVAAQGYVWISSSYRGEDSSEGQIELCLGEVDDVMNMLAAARAQPYANPDKVLMWGGSHGGCITLRALERGAPVTAAMDLFGPTDLASLDRFWEATPSMYGAFIAQLESSAGGKPDAVPAAYQARSPMYFVGDLPASVPLIVVHGTADTFVPYTESCALAEAPLGLVAYHADANHATDATPPAGCASPDVTWQTGALPTSWPGNRYFVAYDQMGHEVTSAAAMTMLSDVAAFGLGKLGTPP